MDDIYTEKINHGRFVASTKQIALVSEETIRKKTKKSKKIFLVIV